MKALVYLVLIIALIVLVPLAIIWSLNTLFSLNIEYIWQAWVAVFILLFVFRGNASYSSS